ncbi:MAG: Uma2 family endonuclease [Rhodocyclaceae bacterium]|nr:Uma2 family endonuclease [Rhodocyclaceae bacterium]
MFREPRQIVKLAAYERAGVQEYWLAHPVDRILTIWRHDGRAYTRPQIRELRGETPVVVLPGVVVRWDPFIGLLPQQRRTDPRRMGHFAPPELVSRHRDRSMGVEWREWTLVRADQTCPSKTIPSWPLFAVNLRAIWRGRKWRCFQRHCGGSTDRALARTSIIPPSPSESQQARSAASRPRV